MSRRPGDWQSDTLDTAGPVAEEIADLWWLLLALGTATFLVFGVMLAIGLRRASDHHSPVEPRDATGERARRWIIGGGVVLPVVGVAAVLGATLASMAAIPGDDVPEDALIVDVIGHQWWWEIRYPELGIVTSDEITIPVGRPVAFRIGSADVIHSFWIPSLGGKLDALPDHVNTLVLEADEPGSFGGHCAEFCGLHHAAMSLVVEAVSPVEFEEWAAARTVESDAGVGG